MIDWPTSCTVASSLVIPRGESVLCRAVLADRRWSKAMNDLVLILTRIPVSSTLRFADALANDSQSETIIISDNQPAEVPTIAKCAYIADAIARENGFF